MERNEPTTTACWPKKKTNTQWQDIHNKLSEENPKLNIEKDILFVSIDVKLDTYVRTCTESYL